MDAIWQDVRYAWRSVARRPGFSVPAVATLALAMSVVTVLFSAVSALLWRDVPGRAPEQLVEAIPRLRMGFESHFTYPQLVALARDDTLFAGIAGIASARFSLQSSSAAEVRDGRYVTRSYFSVLGVAPEIGSFFTATANDAAAEREVVLGYGEWRRLFHGDPRVVGASMLVNRRPVTIVGVAPRELTAVAVGEPPALWVPTNLAPELTGNRQALAADAAWLNGIIRLRTDVPRNVAQVRLADRLRRFDQAMPSGLPVKSVTFRAATTIPAAQQQSMRGYLALLSAIAVLVLLVACVNVAGMLLARASARQLETAVRLAIGAGRWRLTRQWAFEGLMLFFVAACVALAVTPLLAQLAAVVRWPVPVTLDFHIDGHTALFTAAMAFVTGLGASLVPALQIVRGSSLLPALRDAASTPRGGFARHAMVTAQIALTFILLVGAGLFVRAVTRAGDIDPGFNPHNVVLAAVDLSLHGYDSTRAVHFVDAVLRRARELPGTAAASVAATVPYGGLARPLCGPITGDQKAIDLLCVEFNAVDSAYFHVLRIPIRQGRAFTAFDGAAAPKVAIVNEAMAKRVWRGASPIGQHFGMGSDAVSVVGVAADGKYGSLTESAQPYAYLPFAQAPSTATAILLRTRNDAGAPSVAALRGALMSVDSGVVPSLVVTLGDQVSTSVAGQRVAAWLLGGFGLAGLMLASVGLYGTLTYLVGQRQREMAIRVALGAPPDRLFTGIVAQGVATTVGGVALGAIAVSLASRLLEHSLFGVGPRDRATYAGVTVVLLCAGTLAAAIPAWHALRLDPSLALRGR
ncbi:MAG: permease [Gemmatimonadetes bacterium]|nr:permease [Gemmatimonadota bacterium]